MTHPEAIECILSSDHEDWTETSRAQTTVWFHNGELDLRIETDTEIDVVNDSFKAEWANKHPDSSARSQWYCIYYGSTLIGRVVLVTVDGGRATLPIPDRQTMCVEPLPYAIAQIIDGRDTYGTLDEYMERSGLKPPA